jgi:FMN phosphatase YigB (HAD superfamily)
MGQINYEKFAEYDYILIDLDNTIYPECSFLDVAFRNIGILIEEKFKIPSNKIHSYLISEFKKNGRSNLFDKLLKKFHIDTSFLCFLLDVLRNTILKDKVKMFPEAKKIIEFASKNGIKIIVVTNGNVQQQKNKVNSIDWGRANENLIFIYANMYEPKPSKVLWNSISSNLESHFSKGIMIGDSFIDQLFARNLGIDFYFAEWGEASFE